MIDTTGLGTILGVWAHPDDEAFLSAALMATAVDAGQRVVVVSATAGGLGGDAAVRREELRRALAAVGVVEHLVLGYDDGGCDRVAEDEAAGQLAAVIRQVRPDTIVTFGPDGLTGHADHRAVSRWVTLAVGWFDEPPRVLHATKPPAFLARFGRLSERYSIFDPGLPSVTAADDLAVHLEPSPPILARKMAALAAHASQTRSLRDAVGDHCFAEWWAAESFVAADLQELATSSPRTAGAVASVCEA